MKILLRDVRIVNPQSESRGDVVIEDGKIKGCSDAGGRRAADIRIDGEGRIAMPGFIDVHIQGAGGADVLDAHPRALRDIARECATHGVTGFLATTIYRPNGDNEHIANVVECSRGDLEAAQLLGIHIEGPFISAQRRGMINPSYIAVPSIGLFDQILNECKGQLRMMTIAPELPGAGPVIERMLSNQVIPSLGHSSANYEQTLDALRWGVSHVTHLYNTMPPMHHRSPGPIPAILMSSHVTAQIISDGIHIHPAMIRLTAHNLGEDRCVLITDGMRALGLPDGEYEYDGRTFTSSGGAARYVDGTLVGTTLGMNELGKRFLDFTGWGLTALAKAASMNPARLLRLDRSKGSIEAGKDGDVVIMNPDLTVWMTIVKGRIVYDQSQTNAS